MKMAGLFGLVLPTYCEKKERKKCDSPLSTQGLTSISFQYVNLATQTVFVSGCSQCLSWKLALLLDLPSLHFHKKLDRPLKLYSQTLNSQLLLLGDVTMTTRLLIMIVANFMKKFHLYTYIFSFNLAMELQTRSGIEDDENKLLIFTIRWPNKWE